MASNNDQQTEVMNRGSSSAFPFDTENPSGVPGITEIEASVIAAIAGHVARSVDGVNRLGATGGIVRTVADTVRSRSAAMSTGVDVSAGRKEAILDIDLIVEFGHSVPKVVQNVREEVAREIFNLVGLVAKEINVSVVGIEFPDSGPRRRVE
jgi:uncharacterized alkaline shock family protein YloU